MPKLRNNYRYCQFFVVILFNLKPFFFLAAKAAQEVTL
jgi:hypothetical protein